MKNLVIGGGGFLGLYIVEQLIRRGESVRVMGRGNYPELTELGVEVFRADLRDRERVFAACADCNVVYHTASLPGISLKRQPFYETNVLGTQNVIDACLAHRVSKLIYTSSPSVTDAGVPQLGVDESTPYPRRFLSYYQETKAIAEQLVLQSNGMSFDDHIVSQWGFFPKLNQSKRSNAVLSQSSEVLLTCALRPRLIWGPRDHHLIPRLLERAKKGNLVQVGDGQNMLDMIYVENAALAHLLAADALEANSPVAGSVYYLSQGEPVNCWNWINQILELVGLPTVKKRISFKMAWTLGACYEGFYRLFRLNGEPPMTRFLATQLAQSYWFDISKAKKDFNYRPFISTEEGMKRLAECFLLQKTK
ncbi:MAG: NAD-dependent epimerase/dehydratase family protein [Planctomycetia bacterium]|nr:NAD-dependent epimerase/dehydratase family protein [Planctomycetia bacterium]